MYVIIFFDGIKIYEYLINYKLILVLLMLKYLFQSVHYNLVTIIYIF